MSKRVIGVWNEWGRLRECFIGNEDWTVEPDYIPALVWLSEEGKKAVRERAGQVTKEIFPEISARLQKALDTIAKVLSENGVKVHRILPMEYPEEKDYLSGIQKGNMLFGGADFLRVIGTTVILLNSFRMPFRRKQVWVVRKALEPLLKDSNATYISTPPPSPHYREDDLYLENGDIMIDGHNIYVGMSGNSTSKAGVEWLKQLLGDEYRIHIIRLNPNLFHLDWILTLNRPGLLTYCPEALVDGLPDPLTKWDKIEIRLDEVAGANNLSIDEETILMADHFPGIADEYRKRGMKVLTVPLKETMEYGSGARCLTGVLRRDP
ncbi:MAG: hypothetical protein K8T10_00195 [Candidatus Eremiobacteraeota bacterium]|nr:hypothetical protein [Candidatus Eremiobacteraeota bacterium]